MGVPRLSRAYRFGWKEDFIKATDTDQVVYSASGTGAANSAVAPWDTATVGVVKHDVGTTASGRAGWLMTATALRLDMAGRTIMEFRIKTGADLSDGTDTYTIRVGLLDSDAAEPTDGVFLRYIHSANSGKWAFVTRANGTETVTDTGITVAVNTVYRVCIVVQAGAASASCYINDVKVAEAITTNIPTGAARLVGVGGSIIKSAGTTSRTMEIDYAELLVGVRDNFTHGFTANQPEPAL